MQPEIRRIIAVDAHRRRSGHCPVLIYSLGTGESFEIQPTADGFVDITSGLTVRVADSQILLPDTREVIDIHMNGDVTFDGFDHASHESFSGRAGGGASVTLYDAGRVNYFQYAVVAEGGHL
ncbi:MAG: hypothetical protein ACTHLY_04115 [Pseudolabrys sp.]